MYAINPIMSTDNYKNRSEMDIGAKIVKTERALKEN
jgi:hypothetical protein